MRHLQKYLYSFTSVEEEKKLIDNPETNRALFDAWNHFDDIKTSDNQPNSEEIFNSVLQKANIPFPQKKEKIFLKYSAVAAGILILVSLGVVLFNYFYNPLINITVAKGQKKELTLPDGTRIWLNSDTQIAYQKKFNSKTREIFLSGEAYFSVVKDPERPFIVKTTDLDIKVLGTVFNVKSYPDDKTSETTLVSGSLVIEKQKKETNDQPIILKPEQKATYSAVQHEIKVEKVNPDKNINWKQGNLVFDNEKINTVLKKLERWYGIRVELQLEPEDTINLNSRYTMVVKDENIEEVIRLLQLTSPLTFKISDGDGSLTKTIRPEN